MQVGSPGASLEAKGERLGHSWEGHFHSSVSAFSLVRPKGRQLSEQTCEVGIFIPIY